MKTTALIGLFALLFLLLGLGLMVRSREAFANEELPPETKVSPVMANLTEAMWQQSQRKQPNRQTSGMERDADMLEGLESQVKDARGCPVCKEQCPDMSKYIRRDSIPCWNCSL